MSQRRLKKILLVEDEWLLADAIGRKLESEGYQMVTVRDGVSALAEASELKPDLILLDIFLPAQGGLEFLEQLKQKAVLATIPVLVFSNISNTQIMERAKSLGVVDYLIKTNITLDDLAARIKKVVG